MDNCIIQVMQQASNPKVNLLNNGNSFLQLQNFPQIQRSIQQQQSPQFQLPEIFYLGGNIQLNKALYYQRKNKLAMISESPIIQISDLSKTYELEGDEQVTAIKQITLKGDHKQGGIKAGQFVVIRGPSGGGKTTFLNLIGTIDTPSTGTILVDGHVINQGNKDSQNSKLRRDKIGIVFQTFNLLALMSAYENIELPMRIKGQLSQQAMKERTKLLLKRVGLLERADHLPSQLSGGQQQRVAIARSLANSPAIILLDQPTGDLDSKSTIEIMNLILEINNFGYSKGSSGSNYNIGGKDRATIVMVTHNQDLQCYGDRIIFFEDGKIKKQVINEYQFALDPDQYSKYLNTKI